MIRLLARIYTQTDYQTSYRSLAKLVPDRMIRLQYKSGQSRPNIPLGHSTSILTRMCVGGGDLFLLVVIGGRGEGILHHMKGA